MDGDYSRNKKKNRKKKHKDDLSYLSDVLQPSWVRCPICVDDEVDQVILDYGRYFLCPVAIVLWVVLLIITTI